MLVRINNKLISDSEISCIDCNGIESASVVVYLKSGRVEYINEQPAIDLIMRLDPAMLEGKRLKFIKHAWSLHNLAAHPLLQICAWLKLHKLGFWIHDNTIPRPRTK